jgi:tRNA1Val (adenine37-N6)-methyltransferase
MPKNEFFKFKQFTIWQNQTAMKVSTDACILGALATFENCKNILDIGTGTGLLALMTAQNHPNATIDAIEIEENAYFQAKKNVAESPFGERINVFKSSIQQFESTKEYDLIISNPPFFVNATKSSNSEKNIARHTDLLPFSDLISSVLRLMDSKGVFYLLLPVTEMNLFIELATKNQLYCIEKTEIADSIDKPFHRNVAKFSFEHKTLKSNKLIIKHNQEYSTEFIALLKNFYLYL